MTLKQLELFMQVAGGASVGEAAFKSGLTPPAASLALKELQSGLGTALLERVGKRLVLTEAGCRFASRCQGPLAELARLERDCKESGGGGELRVAASHTLADYLLPAQAMDFMAAHPKARVALHIGNTAQSAAAVISGEAQMGFVEGETTDAALERTPLKSDRLIAVSADRALQGERFIDTITDRPWVLREAGSGTRELFLKTLGPWAAKLNIALELTHFEAIKNALKNSPAISCLSSHCVARELERGELFEVKIKGFVFEREFALIRRRDRAFSPLAARFAAFCQQRFGTIAP